MEVNRGDVGMRSRERLRGCVRVEAVHENIKEKGNHHKGHESENSDARAGGRCQRSKRQILLQLSHMPVPVNDAAELREVISKL